ncbi:bifunctional salicylyl-CoA 5-hydroxylase/oxidoreductase [Govanella unica]|uniref:Bifunctional salicylyl-CoA 5-hydroxylase/oxidoreductase n=1 Tax=Govanella unica TaxID=2975056 RepID=A0A9X3Z7C1_9PROT|nr:bifunctional salicylyl-CoA 5-hydroxylase/oxidoreductase [Govania unica]MDA5193997.1 bifunctional salicylyl-CoA 5-hydroxylase/oxidoreductase [Govania unica]
MKIVCIGAGPSGLYFAISMKLRNPDHDVTVIERNKPNDTFGWGVVFSDETMDNLRRNDPVSAEVILDNFAHWDDIDVHVKGKVVTSGGHGFCGIGRMRLLNLLQDRARELGVKLEFETEFELADIETKYADADLVIASDGLNSKIRNSDHAVFQAEVDMRANKFVWLGTHKIFEAFTFIFKETEHGWIWVHAYRFDKDTSTFIVECQPHVYDALGFATMSQEENCRFLEELFAEHLDGNELLSNAKHIRGSAWINFPRVVCGNWRNGRVVLLGDAAHTAHFSIGSGTKLGLEDAMKLAEVLHSGMDLDTGLKHYQDVRHLEVLKIQNAARNSMEWFEEIDRYLTMQPEQFAYSLLTRSQRVSHENLRKRDQIWLQGYEKWFAEHAAGHELQQHTPPMFTPFKLRGMELQNRIVVSPMCMYSAEDGTPNDFHLAHYAARAQGGAGLIYTEMTDVSESARITPGCAGLYTDEHETAWKRIVDYVHTHSDAKFAIQLSHAGPKGSTKIGWEGYDVALDQDNWELLAPSPIAWSPENQTPREMTRADMDAVKADFVAAAKRAEAAGFDMIELHAGHGYLLSAFISPLTNKRSDEYGGSLENRLRYPLEVFRAIRAVWPEQKPMSVRISATDWVGEEGITADDAVAVARAFTAAGADIIDVSAGQTSTRAKPVYGRMFQTPFSDRIRNEAGIATLAVGNIFEIDHVNSILAAGRADLCCLARPHLVEPFWTLKAAIQQNYRGVRIPPQYLSGFEQYERNLSRG